MRKQSFSSGSAQMKHSLERNHTNPEKRRNWLILVSGDPGYILLLVSRKTRLKLEGLFEMFSTTEYIWKKLSYYFTHLPFPFSFTTAALSLGSPGSERLRPMCKGSRRGQKLCKAGRGLNKGLILYQ